MNNNKKKFSRELFIPVVNYIQNKKFDEALVLLDQLSDQNPDIINRFKGSIYFGKSDWESSLLYYQKISEEEKNFKIYNNMGYALFKLGRFLKASLKFKKSLDANNAFITAYENIIISLKLIGDYKLSIKYILLAMDLSPTNQKFKNTLIEIFNYYKPEDNKNVIINVNYKINKLYDVKENTLIQRLLIKKILKESEEILEKKNLNFIYPETQIYRKNKLNLNCDRHFSIFNKHKIIPKYCFSCYKVQITLDTVIKLIKLYFYFNKINLKNNNIRKCMIELRENVIGNYKGYIYASSLKEAEDIKKIIERDLINEKIKSEKVEIKHGCTEFYDQYKLYKNVNEDITDKIYKKNWVNIEKEFDQKNLITERNKEKVYNNTLNEFNLPDFLIIKNWLLYAKIIGDNSYREIFDFNIKDNQLSEIDVQKIQSRKKNN
jgi:tetratricopeptide (TPR) repeat protein